MRLRLLPNRHLGRCAPESVFVRLVIVRFVRAAAPRGMTAVARLDLEVIVGSAQPQLYALLGVQSVVLGLRHGGTLLYEVTHSAVPDSAAENHVDSGNAVS